ncbi:uncharacterized protein LOC131220177 [Magnolia sinica]|uniref:uncharacterized protein LOC131220177 n=1 Tax=Magnolia sinica TaxID=86752 RepID=UPI0026580074|nr:uncharacterized protein LOC131220177 [Magnolia sinica]
MSNQLLSISLALSHLQTPYLLSIVYAKCSRLLRRSLWDDLFSISRSNSGPWAVAGDFNAVSSSSERLGRVSISRAGDDEFAAVINSASLLDAGFSGNRFTWSNNQAENSRIWARLDRSLCNDEWLRCFPRFNVLHLPRNNSDHAPVLLNFPGLTNNVVRPFRFQRMWFLHDGFLQIVKDVWSREYDGSPMLALLLKLRKPKLAVKFWNKAVFGDVSARHKLVESAVEQAELRLQTSPDSVPPPIRWPPRATWRNVSWRKRSFGSKRLG